MKSATIPAVRVEPEFRAEVESLLKTGETLSEFVEQSVREQARRRRNQAEFIARGIRAIEHVKLTGEYFTTEEVLAEMRRKLADAREVMAARAAAKEHDDSGVR